MWKKLKAGGREEATTEKGGSHRSRWATASCCPAWPSDCQRETSGRGLVNVGRLAPDRWSLVGKRPAAADQWSRAQGRLATSGR
jgi:hypothetical protein